MGKDNPGANHGGGGARVGIRWIPGNDRHRSVFIGLAGAERTAGKDNGGVGAGGNGGVAGDFEGTHDLA